MKLSSNSEIIGWILQLEGRYPVERWRIGHIHIWPLVRTDIYLILFKALYGSDERGNADGNTSTRVRSALKLLRGLLLYARVFFRRLPVCSNLYFGAASHRIEWQGHYFNRYFDPLMDKDEKSGDNGLLFEYNNAFAKDDIDYYKKERVIDLFRIQGFMHYLSRLRSRFHDHSIELERFDEFFMEIELIGNSKLTKRISKRALISSCLMIDVYRTLFRRILRKTKCSNVYALYYYNPLIMALNVAAWELGINSYDVQHGGQGDEHLAYAQFSKLPQQGYFELMPKFFWCWDKSSTGVINKWTTRLSNCAHRALTMGNPWIDYVLCNDFVAEPSKKNIVLYTLQPYGHLIEPEIVDIIKKSGNDVRWYLRLHPRQFHEREKLIDLCTSFGIGDKVEIDKAVSLPLAILLKHSVLHITRSSGSVIEATMMQVPTLIMDDLGSEMYKALILKGSAARYNPAMSTLESILNRQWNY